MVKRTEIGNTLTHLATSSIISLSDVAGLHEFMMKESKLKAVIDLKKIKTRPDDGRNYIYINRKQFISNDYTGLVDSLYEHFFGKNNVTLKEFYPQWMIWRRDETTTSNATLKNTSGIWHTMLQNTDIVNIPMVNLRAKDFILFFRALTKHCNITRKRFNNIKSILSGMFYYAVEKEIVERNPLNDINYRMFTYKAVNRKSSVYTLEERKLLLSHLANQDDIYSLGVMLHFNIIVRIGELKSLKWSDISENTIRINTQLLEGQTLNDDMTFNPRTQNEVSHVKGNTEDGFRDMPLTPSAMDILNRIRQINPDGEYILMYGGRPITTVTYNRRLKSFCEAVDIPYRSSHKIRFTVASALYKNGVKDTRIQEWLGHSTLAMTQHYLKNVNDIDEDYEKMAETLG